MIADGKDVNDVRVHAVMTARRAINATYKDPPDTQHRDSQGISVTCPSPATSASSQLGWRRLAHQAAAVVQPGGPSFPLAEPAQCGRRDDLARKAFLYRQAGPSLVVHHDQHRPLREQAAVQACLGVLLRRIAFGWYAEGVEEPAAPDESRCSLFS